MSCCGRNPPIRRGFAPVVPAASPGNPAAIYFRNMGKAGLTAIGGRTGRAYRFDAAGSVVAADPRDAPSLAALPHIVQVRAP